MCVVAVDSGRTSSKSARCGSRCYCETVIIVEMHTIANGTPRRGRRVGSGQCATLAFKQRCTDASNWLVLARRRVCQIMCSNRQGIERVRNARIAADGRLADAMYIAWLGRMMSWVYLASF
jgi:hypothetical protein